MTLGFQFYEGSMTVFGVQGDAVWMSLKLPDKKSPGHSPRRHEDRVDAFAALHDPAIGDHPGSRHNDLMAVGIQVRALAHAAGLPLPSYATAGAAGMDLLAAVTEPVVVGPGERVLIPTGLTIALPSGYELQIRPRSGLALRHGITLPNTPGTIDEDYRGEIQVILLNTGSEAFVVERGARIAQAVLAPVSRAAWVVVESLDSTERDTGGFGSTGVGSGQVTPGAGGA